jgi:hypothetical protein
MTDAGSQPRVTAVLAELRGRSRSRVAEALSRVRGGLALAVQAGLGAGIAWFLARGVDPEAARERALRAAAESGRAYDEGVGFSGGVVVAQIRTTSTDLLRATGVDYAEAPRLVRRAIGWQGRSRTSRRKPKPTA